MTACHEMGCTHKSDVICVLCKNKYCKEHEKPLYPLPEHFDRKDRFFKYVYHEYNQGGYHFCDQYKQKSGKWVPPTLEENNIVHPDRMGIDVELKKSHHVVFFALTLLILVGGLYMITMDQINVNITIGEAEHIITPPQEKISSSFTPIIEQFELFDQTQISIVGKLRKVEVGSGYFMYLLDDQGNQFSLIVDRNLIADIDYDHYYQATGVIRKANRIIIIEVDSLEKK